MASRNRDGHDNVNDFPSKQETDLWVALNRVQQSLYRAMDAEMKEHGLPPLKWYDVLWELERSADDGSRAYALENKSLFEQSNLSRLLARMIDQGLIEEFRCPSDGRGRVYKITSCGKSLRKRMWDVYGPLIHAHMGSLSEEFPSQSLVEGLYSMVEDEPDQGCR